MIATLRIRNIALVDDLAIEFEPGLNILSGETGAGKSVLVGSIELLLGGSMDSRLLRERSASVSVEAAIDSSGAPALGRTVEELGIETADEGMLVVRREITPAGRNRCSVNGHPVTVGMLRNVGEALVDIHSQNAHQSLLRTATHLALLDEYGGHGEARAAVAEVYAALESRRRELERLSADERDRMQRLDLWRFQIREIDEAHLRVGEEEELKAERRVLANAEGLKGALSDAAEALSRGEGSALDHLQASLRCLETAAGIDERLRPLLDQLRTDVVSVEDLGGEVRRRAEAIEADADRLAAIEDRLDLISRLRRKYGNSLDDVLAHRERIASEVSGFEHREERLEQLRTEIAGAEADLNARARALSADRAETARALSAKIEKELRSLGMTSGRFEIRTDPREVGPTGVDDVEFYIAPNPGEALKPLRDIASSGEISRTMLAIKGVVADKDRIPVLIFDEIDVNIGGATAAVVGTKLARLARSHQILCITHLPQVARAGQTHFRVYKKVARGRTFTLIDRLSEAERVEEVARMLGGIDFVKGTVDYAKEIISKE